MFAYTNDAIVAVQEKRKLNAELRPASAWKLLNTRLS